MKINELELGTLVTNGSEYAKVKECVHGNLYYAYIGTADEAGQSYEDDEIAEAVEVSDWDYVSVEECCG